MSSTLRAPAPTEADWPYGIAPAVHLKLIDLFENTPGLPRVWIFGSRARGDHRRESDIDLVADMPDGDFIDLSIRLDDLGLIYRTDLLHWQSGLSAELAERIERERKPFWEPGRPAAGAQGASGGNDDSRARR